MTNQPTGIASYPPPQPPRAPRRKTVREVMANVYQPGQSDEPLMVLHDQLYDDDLSSDEKLARLRQALDEGVLDEMVFWSWVDEFNGQRCRDGVIEFTMGELLDRDALFGELLPARLRKLVQNATRLYMDSALSAVGLEDANDNAD